jgi:hypothetical protein
MKEKKHPYFLRNLTIVFALCLIVSLMIILNSLGFLGPKMLTWNWALPVSGITIFVFIVYIIWSGNNVKCPICFKKCAIYSDEENKSRKLVCQKCQIIWNIGVTYNTDIT